MRAPGVAGSNREQRRAVFGHLLRFLAVHAARGDNRVFRIVQNQAADQRLIVQRDLFLFQQALEREVGRIARSGGTDGARVAADALRPAVVRHGILGLRRGPEWDAALFGPALQLDQVVCHRHRRHRIRFRAPVFRQRAGLARDTQPPLGFTIEFFQFFPLHGPVRRETVHGFQPQIFFRESIASPAPMQRRPADGHGARDDALRRLIFDEIAVPRVLAVFDRPPPIVHAFFQIEQPLSRFDHRDRDAGPQFRQFLRKHGGRNSTADDAHIALVARHYAFPLSCGGGSSEPWSPRQW